MEQHSSGPRTGTLNPWLTIWIRPRATIRAYLDSAQPERHLVPLSIVAGIISAIVEYSTNPRLQDMPPVALAIAAMISGAVGGIIGIYFFGWLIAKVGGWVGGQGRSREIRTAILRGNYMPAILAAIVSIPNLMIPGGSLFSLLFGGLTIVLGIWMLGISILSIAEAHQFSVWKSLLCGIIAGILLMIVLVLVVTVIILLFNL
ncbi:YIP1 family protein [Paenibacillus methanolicus]|uniref:Yip1-like protein n=1 Tax=Paenibacillus methanolicus TaxID=582686 RepID=A0A5S5C1M0_9BACL|nr:YIP1 family protein [Paenibacillus methanolicus]TYP72362.1 Yip1-like protein [Paenibacillus methanolicus]